jgi:hypothetical protein
LRPEIQLHRTDAAQTSPPIPTRQRTGDDSLTRRPAIERNRQLADEKRRRRQLEPALGDEGHPAGIGFNNDSSRFNNDLGH